MTVESELTKELKNIIRDALPGAMQYEDYRSLVEGLAESGGTTGEKTEAYIGYTLLNNRRMKRWDKTLRLSVEQENQIKALSRRLIWLVLTESWCGDAAPTVPAMNKIARLNDNIELKVLLRDEHLNLMDHFLTKGARSIPKLIVLDADTLDVLAEWGPRPARAAQLVADYRAEHGKLTAAFREELQHWYNKDKGQETLNELIDLLALEDIGNRTYL